MAGILIVDDNWRLRLEIERMLADLGYEVAGQAETGAEAIAMARDLTPDLILMDVIMPGEMNGIDAAVKIKAELDIPIIFISGYGDPELIEKAKMIEPFGYVMKPFDKTEIKAFVEIALYKSKIERKLGQANKQLNDMNLSLQQEITNRKSAEEVLSHSQRIAKLGSWELDLNTRIITLSKEHQFMAGKESKITALPLAEYAVDYVVEKDIPILKDRLAFAIQNIENPNYHDSVEYRLKTDDVGGYKDLAVESRFKSKGVINGVAQDITGRKQVEEALRHSEEKYRTILESIGDGYFEVDIAGNLTFFNDSFCRIVGYSEDELMGRNYKENTDKEAVSKIFQIFNRVFTTEKPIKGIRYAFSRKDDRKVHIEVSVSLIRNSVGRKIGFRGITRDVTKRMAAEDVRLELESQLHRAQKMAAMGTLVAGVAHEINNPSNFISINAPMLNKAWQSIIPILEEHYSHNGDFSVGGLPYATMRDRVPQLLAGISDGSGRIKKIVSDLKRFARPDSTVSFEPVDINSAVKSSLTLVSNLLKKSTNNFKIEYGRNIPKIKGNHQHLEQVVINLVQNACQALPDKNKEICVSTSYRKKKETVLIKVRDQGVGIPAESLPMVMDPFFTTRRSSGGTGLGLSVSFSIIEKHSGTLTVASKEGEGTTFTIALPAKGKKDRVRVLVVDDNDMVRKMIVKTLEKDSLFSIEESPNGMDACIKLGSFRPELLILDIRMPDMSGVEVCKRINEDSDFSNMKVIIITGYSGGDDAEKIAKMGFRNFCEKPIRIKDFETMVQKVLNRY